MKCKEALSSLSFEKAVLWIYFIRFTEGCAKYGPFCGAIVTVGGGILRKHCTFSRNCPVDRTR